MCLKISTHSATSGASVCLVIAFFPLLRARIWRNSMVQALDVVALPRARALERAERPLPAMMMADEFLSQLRAQLSDEVDILLFAA